MALFVHDLRLGCGGFGLRLPARVLLRLGRKREHDSWVCVAARANQVLPIALSLAGIGSGELRDGFVEALGGADVASDDIGVAGAGVAAGQRLATDGGVLIRQLRSASALVQVRRQCATGSERPLAQMG